MFVLRSLEAFSLIFYLFCLLLRRKAQAMGLIKTLARMALPRTEPTRAEVSAHIFFNFLDLNFCILFLTLIIF